MSVSSISSYPQTAPSPASNQNPPVVQGVLNAARRLFTQLNPPSSSSPSFSPSHFFTLNLNNVTAQEIALGKQEMLGYVLKKIKLVLQTENCLMLKRLKLTELRKTQLLLHLIDLPSCVVGKCHIKHPYDPPFSPRIVKELCYLHFLKSAQKCESELKLIENAIAFRFLELNLFPSTNTDPNQKLYFQAVQSYAEMEVELHLIGSKVVALDEAPKNIYYSSTQLLTFPKFPEHSGLPPSPPSFNAHTNLLWDLYHTVRQNKVNDYIAQLNLYIRLVGGALQFINFLKNQESNLNLIISQESLDKSIKIKELESIQAKINKLKNSPDSYIELFYNFSNKNF